MVSRRDALKMSGAVLGSGLSGYAIGWFRRDNVAEQEKDELQQERYDAVYEVRKPYGLDENKILDHEFDGEIADDDFHQRRFRADSEMLIRYTAIADDLVDFLVIPHEKWSEYTNGNNSRQEPYASTWKTDKPFQSSYLEAGEYHFAVDNTTMSEAQPDGPVEVKLTARVWKKARTEFE